MGSGGRSDALRGRLGVMAISGSGQGKGNMVSGASMDPVRVRYGVGRVLT